MQEHEALIHDFYKAFAREDAEGMAQCYHPEIEFEDPAFSKLTGDEVGDMWRMLLQRANGNLKISHSGVQADAQQGKANWEAHYPFGKAKRPVHNKIAAQFKFKEGKIYRHKDHFSMWRWSRQALGPMGLLLGWSPIVRNKVQATSRGLLKEFRKKNGR